MKVLCSFLLTLLISAGVFSQAVKTISWPELASAEPKVKDSAGKIVPTGQKAVELTAISVDGRLIKPGEPFSAEGEWLKTLSFTVRNVSDKPISSIRIGFGLPEAKYRDGSSGFSLEYGKELSTGIDYGPQEPIAPGESVVLTRNERHYNRDRDGIKARTGITDFRAVIIGPTVVRFTDGTVWMTYKLPTSVSSAEIQ